MPSFHLQNFGCRANQADGAALAAALQAAGCAPRSAPAAADWIVLNTCTVTAAADAEARRAISRLHRRHPQARIAVTGCYAQRAPEEVAALPGVAVVAGHAEKLDLARRLVPAAQLFAAPKLAAAALLERARPVLKVQDGCGRRCSYCVIPSVRGGSRSVPLGVVLAQAEALVAAGHPELVLSGINLGQWGRDLGEGLSLANLIRALLERTPLRRLRISSIEPLDFTPELMQALDDTRIARHFHLPLQSGADSVLARMHRRYRARDFARLISDLHSRHPLAALGTDVIVGFPGETEAEFAETYALISRLPLGYLHVFPFSERPGTAAAERLAAGAWQPVRAQAIEARRAELARLGAAKRAEFLAGMVGQVLEVVTLNDTHAAGTWGMSDNYARVALPVAVAPGQLCPVRITDFHEQHLDCEVPAA